MFFIKTKPEIQYVFHNPNSAEDMAKRIAQVFFPQMCKLLEQRLLEEIDKGNEKRMVKNEK